MERRATSLPSERAKPMKTRRLKQGIRCAAFLVLTAARGLGARDQAVERLPLTYPTELAEVAGDDSNMLRTQRGAFCAGVTSQTYAARIRRRGTKWSLEVAGPPILSPSMATPLVADVIRPKERGLQAVCRAKDELGNEVTYSGANLITGGIFVSSFLT